MKTYFFIIIIFSLHLQIIGQNNTLTFDGNNDYIDCGSGNDLNVTDNTITIEAWIYPTDFRANYWESTIVGNDNTNESVTAGYVLRFGGSGQLNFAFGNGSSGTWVANSFLTPAGSLTLNTWQHVAAVYDGSNIKLYINGIEENSYSTSTNIYTSTASCRIGNNANLGGDRYMTGKIDEVRIWDDARTKDELRTNMHTELTGSETDLIGYYNLNSTSSTIATDVASNNNGTLTNMVGDEWITSDAIFGSKNCLDFDGVDDYVSIDTNPSLDNNNFSVEFWVKFDDTPSSFDGIIDKGRYSTSNDWYFLTHNSGQIVIFGINGHEVWLGANDNNWHHIAGTYDGTTLRGYIDGVQTGTSTVSYTATTNPIQLGKTFVYDYYFNGHLDEVRIWSVVRSEQEIRENMCKSLVGNESGLAAFYSANNSNGTTLQDFSGNDNDGTLYNTPVWTASTAFNTWLNVDNTSWNTATNWSAASVPDSSDNVGIYGYSSGSQPTIVSALDCNNLVVSSDASLTFSYTGSHTIHGSAFVIGNSDINNGNFLTITGSLFVLPLSTININNGGKITINNKLEVFLFGNFNLKSNASGTGSLILNGTSSGSITTQRWLNVDNKGYKWHYVSSPVSGQAINNTFMTENSIYSPDGSNYNFYRWDEPTDYWIIYGSTGNPVAFGDTEFADAQGYAISRSSSGSLSFTGNIRTSDVNYSATYNGSTGNGFNIVGNPFTSSLGVTSLATSSTNFLTVNADLLDDRYEAIYIWDEQPGYDGTQNDYKIISNGNIGSYTKLSNNYIQPSQAFMIKVISPGGNIAFNKSMQAHSTEDYYKDEKEQWPYFELIVENDELFNSTLIGFNDEMTTGLDPSYDIGKIKGNPNIALYTKLIDDNGVDFAIQALPTNIDENYIVRVGIDILENQELEFSANTSKLDDYNIVLEDRELGFYTDLKNTSYTTMVTESGDGRFFIHFREINEINENNHIVNSIKIYTYGNTIYILNPEKKQGVVSVFNIVGKRVNIFHLTGETKQEKQLFLNNKINIIKIQANDEIVLKKVFL